MSSAAGMSSFIRALEVVKRDYTCGVCAQLCRNPTTLSKCFHMICSEHFESLATCPECGVSLEGCGTYSDERLGPCIDSVKTLDEMLNIFKDEPKPESGAGGKKRGKLSTSKTAFSAEAKEPTPKLRSKRSELRNKEVAIDDDDPIKENKKQNINSKPDTRTKNEKESKESKKQNVSVKSDAKTTYMEKKTKSDNLVSTMSSKGTKAVEKRNLKGETALHIACRLGQVNKIADLLQHGANANTKDNAGWTPLHEVVQNGRVDLAKLLLQFNALINVPGPSNETPLHEAVRYNYEDVAEELVRNGADINARNCKGETPVQLATEDMKAVLQSAADNIIQTQSVNITHISSLYLELDFDDIRVYCVSEFRTVLNKMKTLAKHHGNLNIEPKFTAKVTHLIVDADDDGICQLSLDILRGIVGSIWILSTKWVLKSTYERLESFGKYEVTGVGTKTYNGPKNARYNKYKQFPGIFNGCHFYLHNFHTEYEISDNIVITKAILSKLISDAGGVLLRRVPNPESIPDSEKLVPYHARTDGQLVNCSHYIIYKDMYEPKYNMQHLKALPIGWLIECFEKYELCEPW